MIKEKIHLFNGTIEDRDGVYFAIDEKGEMITYNKDKEKVKINLYQYYNDKIGYDYQIDFFKKIACTNFSVYRVKINRQTRNK